MVEIQSFIREELSDHNRLAIYQGMLEGVYGERLKLELIFNRYSIELDFENDTAIIYDDVMGEDEPIKTNVKTFFNMLQVSS